MSDIEHLPDEVKGTLLEMSDGVYYERFLSINEVIDLYEDSLTGKQIKKLRKDFKYE